MVGKVVSVLDGDTIIVVVTGNQQQRIRFAGIDASRKQADIRHRILKNTFHQDNGQVSGGGLGEKTATGESSGKYTSANAT